MWNLIVFALIGLFAGTAARMLYPRRQPMRILGTIVLGIIGALVGGMVSYIYWPAVDDQFHSGNLIVSLLGAMIVIAFSAGVAYARRLDDRASDENTASATRLVRRSWAAWEVRSGCPTRNRFKAFSTGKTPGPSNPSRGHVAATSAFGGTSEP